jgi:methylglutaconyl-CoA hydratase
MSESVLTAVDSRGVATVTLNRPDQHNAFDAAMVSALRRTLVTLAADPAVRVLILTGAGKTFCSGADIAAMRALMSAGEEENLRDALQLSDLLAVLNALPCPTIARINGHAFGGAVGLIACCDLAVASRDARLGLTEVRLGLVPAAISPYVISSIGVRQARRYFHTAELIDAEKAQQLGLVHEVAAPAALDAAMEALIEPLLKGGPRAQREIKELIGEIAAAPGRPDENLRRSTAQRLARLRVSEEGQEGMGAFLEKKPASWVR